MLTPNWTQKAGVISFKPMSVCIIWLSLYVYSNAKEPPNWINLFLDPDRNLLNRYLRRHCCLKNYDDRGEYYFIMLTEYPISILYIHIKRHTVRIIYLSRMHAPINCVTLHFKRILRYFMKKSLHCKACWSDVKPTRLDTPLSATCKAVLRPNKEVLHERRYASDVPSGK